MANRFHEKCDRQFNCVAAIYTRPQQTGAGTTSASQDLVGNTGSGSFNNPTGSNLGSVALGASLTAGNQYTMDYRLTYDAGSGKLTIAENLYTGNSVAGSIVYGGTNSASGASLLTTSFDGVAIGYRFAAPTGAASTMDVNQVTITSEIAPVPEPTTLVLAGLGSAALLIFRRRRSF